MPKQLTQKEAFEKCIIEGRIIPRLETDTEKIRTILKIAEADFEAAKKIKVGLTKDSMQWNSVFKLHYDVLHELVDAFLCFDKVKLENHQCLFAFLCEKHPDLLLNWDFLEKIRTKRNGILYYGLPVAEKDWKEVELQFGVYISLINKEINNKLNNH